jgi:hypothetical protein
MRPFFILRVKLAPPRLSPLSETYRKAPGVTLEPRAAIPGPYPSGPIGASVGSPERIKKAPAQWRGPRGLDVGLVYSVLNAP